jgi:predicted outer membrane repeat protein
VVSDDVSIAGAGQTNTIIDGNATDRVFYIDLTGRVVEFSGVTIQNGYSNRYGGGIFIRSYYEPRSDIRLTDSTVSGNTARDSGGGIRAGGDLTLTNSTVSGNNAGGGRYDSGGGIWSISNLTLTDSTVSGNTAYWSGGGIRGGAFCCGQSAPNLALINSTVSGNNVDQAGGGIYAYNAILTVTNSTVSDNNAGLGGGGIFGRYIRSATPPTLTNSTVSNNSAGRYGGGGLLIFGNAILANTIVADNGTTTPNCNRVLDSLGYNLTDDDSCGFTAPGDLVVTDAMLGPLQDNGGPTETHALLAGSPAIDAGSPDCPPPTTDQRGVARPQGAGCDIGAFESGLATILVEIDIKPGGDPNSINPSLEGDLPVAIVGSDSFDVADVDVTTLAFGPSGASFDHSHGPHFDDVNDDGFTDLMAHYRIEDTGIEFGEIEACVTGDLLDGTPFNGCDAVRTVPDMDGDSLLDIEEEAIGTHALRSDTDGDGFDDGEEVLELGTDPLDPLDPEPTPVPEPKGWLMLIAGAVFLGVVYRRRARNDSGLH